MGEIEQLVRRAKKRDPDAFTELMQLHEKDMYRTASAILPQDADIADAIQETILTVWEKIDTLQKNRYFKTWMIRILINKCKDILRSGRRMICVEELPEQAAKDTVEAEANLEWNRFLIHMPHETPDHIFRLFRPFLPQNSQDSPQSRGGSVRERLAFGQTGEQGTDQRSGIDLTNIVRGVRREFGRQRLSGRPVFTAEPFADIVFQGAKAGHAYLLEILSDPDMEVLRRQIPVSDVSPY